MFYKYGDPYLSELYQTLDNVSTLLHTHLHVRTYISISSIPHTYIMLANKIFEFWIMRELGYFHGDNLRMDRFE